MVQYLNQFLSQKLFLCEIFRFSIAHNFFEMAEQGLLFKRTLKQKKNMLNILHSHIYLHPFENACCATSFDC